MNKTYEKQDLICIILMLSAFVLRILYLDGQSFSNDELSALSRLPFQSFSELIQQGVLPDFHPAGVQVFLYYWTSIFGTSDIAVRFPFAIMGTFSVLLTYLIGKKLFGLNTALLAASSIAFLDYTMLYSQIARPYSSGLFFILAMTYSWLQLNHEKIRIQWIFAYVVFTVGCMYNHYFSFLLAIIIGASGLVLFPKKGKIGFIIGAFLSVLCFLPHLSISLEQFGRGGLASWLGKPENDAFIQYLFYAFNQSNWLIFTLIVLIIIGLISSKFQVQNKWRYWFLGWFLIHFFIAFFYSKWVNPVLQFSIIIFSFPFLLFFIFSWIDDSKSTLKHIFIGIYVLTLIGSTFIEKKYYSTNHFSEFRDIAKKTSLWQKEYAGDIVQIINVEAPFYIHYYQSENNEVPFAVYRLEKAESDLPLLASILDTCKSQYFSHSWSNKFNALEIDELIKRYYPEVLENHLYFNSGTRLYKKGLANYKNNLVEFVCDFDTENPAFSFHNKFIDTTVFYDGSKSLILDNTNLYAPNFSISGKEILEKKWRKMVFSAFSNPDSLAEITLVYQIENKNGEQIFWRGLSSKLSHSKDVWRESFIVASIPEKLKADDVFKFYVWNNANRKINIDKVKLEMYP